MGKRLKLSHIKTIIESKVREALLKEEYDEVQKKHEIDAAWKELDAANNKYASIKANPLFASKYNHNVEDGIEEAETYASGLYETIYKMVEERLF